MTEGWIALFVPLLLWAQVVWASPFLKTYRHKHSAILAVAAGMVMFAALSSSPTYFMPLFIIGVATMVATFVVLLWPKKTAEP
ncbi:hypothetical protein [Sphingobium sp. ba1]|uniref:hypothetical protein n=1 Tax=Sphingobium sp. ba1 TaxID=1522072 RepID=UPI0012E00548|nr:hypothetical protein [Sphingobium sp. ba1]